MSTAKPRWNYISFLFVIFGAYAVIRTSQSLYHFLSGQAVFQHDIWVQYLAWLDYINPDTASKSMSSPTYLPHVWLLLTPLFSIGWTIFQWIWCCICFLLQLYIWHRISTLCALNKIQRRYFLILYFGLLSVGITIALGNLVVVSVAAILAAFPFETESSSHSLSRSDRLKKHLFLFLSTAKHITVYPVFMVLLFRRPRLVIPTMAAVLVILAGSLWWAHLSPVTMLQNFKQGHELLTKWMHETPGISLVPLFEPLGVLGTVIVWTVWIVLFVLVLRIKDPFIQLSAFLLIALLPIHHREYDMIVAGPVLALLVKRGNLLLAMGMTALLSGLWTTAAKRHFFGLPLLDRVDPAFYQLAIFALLAILFWINHQETQRSSAPEQARA
jgi:hypothetical protein